MIHPSEILRMNSDDQSHFSAPVGRNRRSLDCGLNALPWLTEKLDLSRFATAKVFLAVFGFLGLLQGALLSYFRGTSHIWTQHYYFGDTMMDWLIHLNEILVGVFALSVTYWGDKIHRATWFGGMVMLQGIACITLVVPEVYETHVDDLANRTDVDNLCTRMTILTQMTQPRESNWVALATLVIFHMFLAFATIVFYTLGITYLDDNIEKENAPIYLIIPLATKIAGKQLGMYLSWIPTLSNDPRVFVTGMWLVISSMIFMFGFIIVLFPYSLPAMIVQRAAASLVNLANNTREAREVDDDDDDEVEAPKRSKFFAALLRLITNPILVINSLAMVFMSIALVNFEIHQNIFFQLRFFVNVGRDLSGYHDPFLAQVIMNIIKYPFIAISLLVTGLIVAKTQPTAKYLAIFNVAIYIASALLYVSFVFSRCDDRIHSEFDDKLTIPYCSSHCICKNIAFAPVCTQQENVTYFSPCHAGCKNVETIRGVDIFGNCTCGSNIHVSTSVTAVSGSCQKDSCNLHWAFAQISSVMASSILATTIVTNLMINLRCVSPEDKPLALGFETTLLGILPYIPGKLVYSAVAESMCIAKGEDRCFFHSESFGMFFSITTVSLMAVSAILAFIVIFLIGNLSLYGEDTPKQIDDDDDPNVDEIERVHRLEASTRQNENNNNNPTTPMGEHGRLMATRNNDNETGGDDLEDLDFDLQSGQNPNPNTNVSRSNTNAEVHNESKNKKTPEVLESDF